MSVLPPEEGVDQGLFEHEPGGHYLHLLREVIVTYRAFLRQLAAESDVSVAQLELLRQLALAGGRSTMSKLARELAVDPAAVTRLVAGLEQRGIVARESDERDQRLRPVVITDAGRRQMTDFHRRLHERESRLGAVLDEASIDEAMRVLRTIRSVVSGGVLPVAAGSSAAGLPSTAADVGGEGGAP